MEHVKTRVNHYTPRFYMKYFNMGDGVYTYIKTKKETRILKNFKSTAQQRSLYAIQGRYEYSFLENLLKEYPLLFRESEKTLITTLFWFMQDKCSRCFDLFMSNISNSSKEYAELQSSFESFLDGSGASLNLELLASHYEDSAKAIIDDIVMSKEMHVPIFSYNQAGMSDLKNFLLSDMYVSIMKNIFLHVKTKVKDFDFSAENKEFLDFKQKEYLQDCQSRCFAYLLRFILFQYARVPRFISNYFKQVGVKYMDGDEKIKIVWFFFMFYTINLIAGVALNENFHFVLFEAVGECKFITSDNPVLPLECEGELSKQVIPDLYVPLSPTRSLLLTKRSDMANLGLIRLDDSRVKRFNRYMNENAYQFIFSPTEKDLDESFQRDGA